MMSYLRQPAAVACMACRKMKMRCVGAHSPPCRRCLKSNRECVVRLPNRHQRRFSSCSRPRACRHTEAPPDSPVSSYSPTLPHLLPEAATLIQPQQGAPHGSPSTQGHSLLDQAGVPSIFSSSPLAIASSKTSDHDCSLHTVQTPTPCLGSDQLSHSIIRDLVEFFIPRLLFYVPVLSLEPMDDPDVIVNNRRPLAYAMAFVASTFALGYSSTRKSLFPHILKIVEQASDITGNSQAENWTLLQALAVLYAYPEVAIGCTQAREQQLSIWAVKSAAETCAMQQSLHYSVYHLKELVGDGEPNISTSLPYRRAFYWVWLFVKSRHHSVITRTPPTIQNDTIIISTADLLLDLEPSASVRRVLAEAALHRVWDQAACRDKGLGEWWCTPSSTKDMGALQELLEHAEARLQEWSSTWLQSNEPLTDGFLDFNPLDEPNIGNSITTFMGLLTRFNMISFAAPIISHQLVLKTGSPSFSSAARLSSELSSFLNCVLKSADAASKCCDSILDLKPTAREQLRYTPDYGFTMIALCCLHLVYAYNMSPDNVTLRNYLAKAEQLANLMVELGDSCSTLSHLYGECILSHLRNTTSCSTLSVDGSDDGQIPTLNPQLQVATNPGGLNFGPHMASNERVTHRRQEALLSPIDMGNDHWPTEDFSPHDPLRSFHGQLPDLFTMYSDLLLDSNVNQL